MKWEGKKELLGVVRKREISGALFFFRTPNFDPTHNFFPSREKGVKNYREEACAFINQSSSEILYMGKLLSKREIVKITISLLPSSSGLTVWSGCGIAPSLGAPVRWRRGLYTSRSPVQHPSYPTYPLHGSYYGIVFHAAVLVYLNHSHSPEMCILGLNVKMVEPQTCFYCFMFHIYV